MDSWEMRCRRLVCFVVGLEDFHFEGNHDCASWIETRREYLELIQRVDKLTF